MKKKNPYDANIIEKCDVCGQIVLVDEFGNGDCEHCGWNQNNINIENPDIVTYPNTISLNKAKFLYKQKKPLIPSFEDFVDGLFMYSEMRFEYIGKRFGVILYKKDKIELFENQKINSSKFYKSREDFMSNANIEEKLLKDIWKDVKNADFMQCG
ncbi:MAG: CPCC family cysteine-rich protein [Clostridia bacterium]|nr:CPCC family cysteine-rich protein [Clostridia bacterium]